MPVQPTYPGVYIEEIPSGVRTITGVSTSVAAFVGSARRGPINKAVRILSYADYERRFGGLDAGSEMSYAVRQFFANGGTDSWVVRLASGALAASRGLETDTPGQTSLTLTALEQGFTGNSIQVQVDRATSNPASTFNLTLTLLSPDNPNGVTIERFENLSMNSKDARYVKDVVNGNSQLVSVERPASLSVPGKGTSTSGLLSDVGLLLDSTHNQFFISVNGLDPVLVKIDSVTGTDATSRLDNLRGQIESQVTTSPGAGPALTGFKCTIVDGKLVLTSGTAGEFSSVRVLPAPNDASARLKLGTLAGGIETDAVAVIRPHELPEHGKLVSGHHISAPTLTLTTASQFRISLDGSSLQDIDLGTAALASGTLAAQLAELAGRVQTEVRKKSGEAFKNFTCIALGDQLVLESGTRGLGSSVQVFAASTPAKDVAAALKLLAGATATPGKTETLSGGNESPIGAADIYSAFIGSRADRTGIFALEAVDLFNLLCLPAITDPGVLADAVSYCQERRAFLIADAPFDKTSPAAMVTTISGTDLPKSDYAAVYYPWIRIADPLKSGKLRPTSPCGTIAGLYARTDSNRGVWKAPAGTEATLTGVQAVEYALTDRENGTLNPLGVNCIRVLPVYGAVSWGARTLRGADAMASEWKYIPVRRLALYIEESLFRGSQWVVFEPNDEPLWSQIRLNVGAFMHTLFRQGAFQGKTPNEAYLVKCDKETTTQDDINRGVVNILVGFAPLKPAEFVILKIQQLAGQIQT